MQPQEARFLLNVLLPHLEKEICTSRKVIAAVPLDKGDYRPHPASTSALDLAWHLASADYWFLDAILRGQFLTGGGERPAEISSAAAVAAWHEANLPPLLERLKTLSDDEWARPISFLGIMELPAVNYLLLAIVHSVHHRGQLSAYLRPMGAKVPQIYGPSADDPGRPPA